MQILIVDTTGIQPYIFGSNRLRENFGASHLVAQATRNWAFDALPTPHNVGPNDMLDRTKCIESPTSKLQAEVLYSGGGNIVVLFRNEADAKSFTKKLSCRLLTDAPGLQLVVARESFEWSESLYEKMKLTFKKLSEEKHTRALSAPSLGLGVTVMCRSTGLPAVRKTQEVGDDDGYPASAEIHAKLAAATPVSGQPSDAGKRLNDQIPPPNGYDYPNDFEYLGGTKGEHSYIAVVHADGNGMGQRIMDIGRNHATADRNRRYIEALWNFSTALEKASQDALKITLKKLVDRIDSGEIAHPTLNWLKIKLSKKTNAQKFLPFRPIVFGGDDVTFVCDGRLGLSLAIEYLSQFEDQTSSLPDNEGKATACAGIAIVKSHYPFARAYDLAEGLCKSAKGYRREHTLDGSCLDWHFAMSGLTGEIEEIRNREYKVSEGDLTLRPMTVDANPNEPHRSWQVIRAGVNAFQGDGWAKRRNKVKALRDALRGGCPTVKSFVTKFNESNDLPDICSSMTDWKRGGWQGGACGYFDAVEMIDWYIPL